jgi:hypothetical protein
MIKMRNKKLKSKEFGLIDVFFSSISEEFKDDGEDKRKC